MAENLEDLYEIEKVKARIVELDKLEKNYAQKSSQYSKRKLKEIQSEKKEQENLLKLEQSRLKEQKALQKEQITFAKSFTKLSGDVKKLLKDQNTETSIYQSLNADIAKSKVKQLSLTGDALESEIEREQYLSEINASLLQQAQLTAKAEADSKGLSEFEQKRLEIRENSLNLSDEELKKAEAAVNIQEKMFLKQQRLEEIERQRGDLVSQMPDGIQQAVGFTKKLGQAMKAGFGPLMIAGAVLLLAIKSFKDLDDAAKEFRDTTGLTNSQMEGIKSDVNAIVGEFAGLGIEAKNVFDTVAALKSEFSDSVEFSREIVAGLSVLNANFGVSAENAAKVQGIFESMGGLSSETATSVQLQVANMAKLAGVAPSKVFEDIAQNAEIASTFYKGDINALAKAAIEARRLGTNIGRTAEIAEGLLDFENSITKELEASAMLGTSINFNKARELAFQGKTVQANEEILNQIKAVGDFQSLNVFEQKALADASGMTVEEINKQLNVQEKLNSLSGEQKKLAEDAINNGLDISQINKEDLATQIQAFSTQQEQQKVLDQISNQFTGIAATVGSVLVPLLETLLPIISYIALPVQAIAEGFRITVNFLKENIALSLTLLGILGLVYAKAIAAAVARIWGSIVGALGPFGIPVAIAATIGAISMAKSAMNVGDLNSPADGKTRVSTKEGGLFELSPNDDVVAAPGLTDYLKSMVNTKPDESLTEYLKSMVNVKPDESLTEYLKSMVNVKPDESLTDSVNPMVNTKPDESLTDSVNPMVNTKPETGLTDYVKPSVSTSMDDTTSENNPQSFLNFTELINEIKGLRADLNGGKVAVYMDGKKVTSSVNRVMDRIGTNFYGAT
jgi:hypothetical protein